MYTRMFATREKILSKNALSLFDGFLQVYALTKNAFKQVAGFFNAGNGIEYGKLFHGKTGLYLVPMQWHGYRSAYFWP